MSQQQITATEFAELSSKMLEVSDARMEQIIRKLDNLLIVTAALNSSMRDLAAALNIRDDIQTRSIGRLGDDQVDVHSILAILSKSLDDVKAEFYEKTVSLKSQILILQELLPKDSQ
jgi:hypothetical protein